MELSERKKQILRAVVENYIQTAEPVGSKAIVAAAGLKVSSATIRWRTWATWSSPTPPPGASPLPKDTACTSTNSWRNTA